MLRRDAVTVAEEAEFLAFVNDGLARGRNGSLRKPTYLRKQKARGRGATGASRCNTEASSISTAGAAGEARARSRRSRPF